MPQPGFYGEKWGNRAFWQLPRTNPNDDVYIALETGPVFRPPLVTGYVARSFGVAIAATFCVNLLTSTLGTPAVAAPFSQKDWPNPRGATPAIELRTYLDPSETWLLKDKFFGAPGQPPANLDWPVPRGPRIDQRGFADPLKIQLLVPFAQDDWPNPRGAIPSVELRTFIDPSEVWLFGTDQFFGAPGQPPNYDYPNPRGPTTRTHLGGWSSGSLLQNTLGFVAPTPFAQDDWPNPRGAIPSVELRTFIDPSEVWLFGTDQFFGAPGQPPNYDYPNPRGPTTRTYLGGWSSGSLLQNTLGFVAPYPFSQTDWPVPRGAAGSIALRSWLDPLKLLLAGKDQFFGASGQPPANLDWPIPKGRSPDVAARTWTQNLQQGTLAPATAVPFSLSEWPNPRGYIAGIGLRTWIDPLKLELRGQDKFFGASGQGPAYDWTNPLTRWRWKYVFDAQRQMSPALASGPVPGVFPPESPVHFHIGLRTRRLGDPDEAPASERLGTDIAPDFHRLGDATEAASTERLGEANETPDAERLGSDSEKAPGRGLGS